MNSTDDYPPVVANRDSIAARSVSDWTGEINAVWTRGPASTLELARVIYAARRSLVHGEWSQLWRSGCVGLSKRKAEMLSAIGARLGWLNAQTFAHLPRGWSILYQLAKLDRSSLWSYMADGTVHPALTLQQAKDLVAQLRGSWVKTDSTKSNVRLRLKKFADFVRAKLKGWSLEEQEYAQAELGRLVEDIDGAALNHPQVVAPRATLSVETFSASPSFSRQKNLIALG